MKTLREKHIELCRLLGEDEAVRKLHGFYDRAIRKAKAERETPVSLQKAILRIIEHLNMITGFHYRSTNPETRKLIRARLAEKYTIEDFKKVHIEKARQWLKKDDMRKYLRPSTLYRASRFEGYLQEYYLYRAKLAESKNKKEKEEKAYQKPDADTVKQIRKIVEKTSRKLKMKKG